MICYGFDFDIGSRRDNDKENRTVMCVWDLRRTSDTRTVQHSR